MPSAMDQAQQQQIHNFRMLRGLAGAGFYGNRDAAHGEMQFSPQEMSLYNRHLDNLYGSGGVTNPDGSRSTLYQITTEIEGKNYVIPTVWEGKILTADEAIARAKEEGLDTFPSYPTGEEAEARYQKMHDFMEKDTQRYFSITGGKHR
jgi:hypothetical protein